MIPPTVTELEQRVKDLEKMVASRFPVTVQLQQKARRSLVVETIINTICEEFHITSDYLLSNRRNSVVTWPRHIAMALSYELSGFSTNALAVMFNRKDHVIILYAVKRVRDEQKLYESKAKDVANIRKKIKQAMRNGEQ